MGSGKGFNKSLSTLVAVSCPYLNVMKENVKAV
jgi:hypothetical protein